MSDPILRTLNDDLNKKNEPALNHPAAPALTSKIVNFEEKT